MRNIGPQLSSMVGYENCAVKALSKEGAFQNIPQQAVFSWNTQDRDLSSKRIICHDKEAAPAVLAYREDLSVPFAHDYGLLFEVYEHGEHIAIYASWDHNLVSVDLVGRLVRDFEELLVLVIKREGASVRELLAEHRAGGSGKVVGLKGQ